MNVRFLVCQILCFIALELKSMHGNMNKVVFISWSTNGNSFEIMTKHLQRCGFFLACDVGFYGSNCKDTCGQCLEADNCSFIDGACFGGCIEGYTGDTCYGKV